MPVFGIRYTSYENAHPVEGKPLPYEEWAVLDYGSCEFTDFARAKECAEIEMRYSERNVWDAAKRTYVHRPTTVYMAFKLPPEADYVTREAKRQAAGEYEILAEKFMPENGEAAYTYARLIVSENEPPLIGYYETASDARYDRLKKVKPTKYFTYYFSEDIAWDLMAELGLASASLNIAFVNTREDIRYVYENGPESCMSGQAQNYYSDAVHPTEAYASPDLELAVIWRGDADFRSENNNIISRALCNRKTKQYVRIYGDIKRAQDMLKERGYSKNTYALGGCRLLKIFGQDQHNGNINSDVVMVPYLDGSCTRIKWANPDDEYMEIIIEERIFNGSTSGYINFG